MPAFIIIGNEGIPEQYKTSEWKDAKKFKSRGKPVDKLGKTPVVDLTDEIHIEVYKLKFKKVRQLSYLERAERGFLGIAAIICSLGFALFSKNVRKLLTKSTESVRFGELAPINLTPLPPLPSFSLPPFKKFMEQRATERALRAKQPIAE